MKIVYDADGLSRKSTVDSVAFANEQEAHHPAKRAHETDVGEDESEFSETGPGVSEVAVDDGLVKAEALRDACLTGESFAGWTVG